MEFLNEECKNHPRKQAYGRCANCWQFFCNKCMTDRNGYQYCHDCVVKVPVKSAESEAGSDAPPKKRKVSQWLMFTLILAMSALLLDIFYFHWGVIGDITDYNGVLYSPKSYGTQLNSFKKKRTEHFIVYYHDDQIGESVSQQVEPDFQRICSDLLIDPKDLDRRGNRFLVILTGTDDEYMKISNEKSAAAGAVTDYTTKSVIIDVQRSGPTITSTLPHEMTHVIVFEFMNSGNKIPNWLHEGLASYEEAKFDDSQVTKRNAYLPDIQQGQRKALSSMVLPDDAETTEIQIYYTQSYSVVAYMIDTYGMYKFMTFCKKLQTGSTMDAALTEAYAGDIPNVSALESKWLEHIGA